MFDAFHSAWLFWNSSMLFHVLINSSFLTQTWVRWYFIVVFTCMKVRISLTLTSVLLDVFTGIGLLHHVVTQCLILWDNFIWFSKMIVLCQFIFPPTMCKRSSFFLISFVQTDELWLVYTMLYRLAPERIHAPIAIW